MVALGYHDLTGYSISEADPECRDTIPKPNVQKVFTNATNVTTAAP